MAEEKFSDNLMRMVAAELHFLCALSAAREMYGRSYFSLGIGEKTALDQALFGHIQSNYQAITPQFLASQATGQPVGFVPPKT